MDKYYLVSFAHGRITQTIETFLTKENPLEWQKRMRERYEGGQYKLIGWNEITQEEFETYKDCFPN